MEEEGVDVRAFGTWAGQTDPTGISAANARPHTTPLCETL